MRDKGVFKIVPDINQTFYIEHTSDYGDGKEYKQFVVCKQKHYIFYKEYDLTFSSPYKEFFKTKKCAKKAIDYILRRWEKEEEEEKVQEKIDKKWCKDNPPEIYP